MLTIFGYSPNPGDGTLPKLHHDQVDHRTGKSLLTLTLARGDAESGAALVNGGDRTSPVVAKEAAVPAYFAAPALAQSASGGVTEGAAFAQYSKDGAPRQAEHIREMVDGEAFLAGEMQDAVVAAGAEHGGGAAGLFVPAAWQRALQAGWIEVAAAVHEAGVFGKCVASWPGG